MAEPLIFINTYRVRPGKLEDYRKAAPDWFAWNEAGHPRLLHHEVYVDDDGEVTNVQIHPDVASMEEQMQLIGDVHAKWQEYIDWATMRVVVCGAPSDAVREGLGRIAGAGVPVTIKARVDGFSRLPG